METQQLELPKVSHRKKREGNYCLGLSAAFKDKGKDYEYLLKKDTCNIGFVLENFHPEPIINAYLMMEFYEDGEFLTQSLSEFFNLEGKDDIQSIVEVDLEYPSFFHRNFNLLEVRLSLVEEIKFHNKTPLLQIPFQYLNGKFRLSELSFRYTDE